VGTAADAAATSLRAWSAGGGAEFGGAFHRQGGGGQVPGPPVRLVGQGARELAVRGGALRKRREVVDGGADEGMGEVEPGPIYVDQAQLLGRHENLRARPGNSRRRAQVRAVGHRGQQQRSSRWLCQRAEPGTDDGGQPVT
jgi:hypothetical protein